MALTPRSVFRYYEVDGVPSSGKRKPPKSEIIQLLEQMQGSASAPAVVRQTRAELEAVTPASETYGGMVLNDPNPANNGYYSRSGGAWVGPRPFPDTFARVALSGSGTAQTGEVQAGVNPASIEVFFAKVATANTGPLTLSISGEPPKPVINLAGNPLSAGEWTGMVMFYLNDDGDYQLLIDAGASASAAQSASDAADILAEFLTHFLGNYADDMAAAVAAGTPDEGQFYWNTTSKVYRYYDGDAWQAFPYSTVADGAVTNAKLSSMSAATVKGRPEGSGEGLPSDLSAAQVFAILQTVGGVLHVQDRKVGALGGNFAQGGWRARDLNTILVNTIPGADLNAANGQITLPAGKYVVSGGVPAYSVQRHRARIFNVTTSLSILTGRNAYASQPGSMQSDSLLVGGFELSETTNLRLEHRCELTNAAGFGISDAFGDVNIYTDIAFARVPS